MIGFQPPVLCPPLNLLIHAGGGGFHQSLVTIVMRTEMRTKASLSLKAFVSQASAPVLFVFVFVFVKAFVSQASAPVPVPLNLSTEESGGPFTL